MKMRAKDEAEAAMLRCCRAGQLRLEVYFFLFLPVFRLADVTLTAQSVRQRNNRVFTSSSSIYPLVPSDALCAGAGGWKSLELLFSCSLLHMHTSFQLHR